MLITFNLKCHNPLIRSYLKNDIKKFRQLIDDGININSNDGFENSLISFVVSNIAEISDEDNNKFFDILMENNVLIEQIDGAGNLLYWSLLYENKYCFKKLIDSGIDINSHNYYISPENGGEPIIFYTIDVMDSYYLNLILNKDLDINVRSRRLDDTILNDFIKTHSILKDEENLKIFQRLIDLGADINDRGDSGMQAIHCIALSEKNCLFDILFNGKMNYEINSRDANGDTALMCAVKFDNFDGTDILIKKGAFINVHNSNGKSPLHFSIMNDNDRIFDLLLKNDAVALTVDKNDCNILHNIIQTNWKNEEKYNKYYEKIIKKQPNLLFSKNKDGKTPIDLLDKIKTNNPKKEFFENIAKKLNNKKTNDNKGISL